MPIKISRHFERIESENQICCRHRLIKYESIGSVEIDRSALIAANNNDDDKCKFDDCRLVNAIVAWLNENYGLDADRIIVLCVVFLMPWFIFNEIKNEEIKLAFFQSI